jgi:hypothetical protein
MNELCDLKRLFESNKGYPITSFDGKSLVVGPDTWTLAHGIFYKNGLPTVEKEVVKSVLPQKQRIHKPR